MPDTLLDPWQKTCRRLARRRALTEAAVGTHVTFAELDARGRAWAAQHASARLRGRLVLFSVPNGVAWFDVFLGLQHAGAVAAPLDPGEPAAAVAAAARDLRAAAWWDGTRLQESPGAARTFHDPTVTLIKLTSGSTGVPRPLVFTAAQMVADGRQVMRGMGITARDRNYALIPFGHSYGLGNLVLPLLTAGVPIVVGSAPFPHAIAADFARWRPTVFPGVPALWRVLAASEARLRGLRRAISAGGPLGPEVAQEFKKRHGIALHSFYGSSETGGISYDRSGADTLSGRVGRTLPGVSVRVLRGQRLLVSSAAVVTQNNARPRERGFGTWIMADRVEINSRGSLRLLGRAGSLVKIGGRRVSLPDVAARLRALPGVSDAWVAVSEGAEPTLGAAVVTALAPTELRARAQSSLPAWKIPKALACFAALPLTARGKTDTAALRQAVFGRASDATR